MREPAERETVLGGPPCVIVASSGMLSGGPSSLYAARLASSQDALIAITGYQDEEAPGRRLQEAANGHSSELYVNNQAVKVACRVETYGLSAHADAQELSGLVEKLKPARVALVHGDGDARTGLAKILSDAGQGVVLPAAGETLEFNAKPRTPKRRMPGIGKGRALGQDSLAVLHGLLWKQAGARRSYPVRELAETWYGSEAVPDDLDPLHELLRTNPAWFEPDARRPFCYRPVDPSIGPPVDAGPVRDEAGRLEQNAALAEVDRRFGPDSGLYRRGAERETWTLRLYFHFPDVAGVRHAAEIDQIERDTGWKVKLHPETHLGALEQHLRACLPPGSEPVKPPSVFKDERLVKVAVTRVPNDMEDILAAFGKETGFTLSLVAGAAGTPAAKKAFDEHGCMEVNLAFRAIEEAFSGQNTAPTRKSKKNDSEGVFLELSFISPEVGERQQDIIDRLQEETGWRIRIAERVDQQAVLRIASEVIPRGWNLARNPGLDLAGRKVLLKFSSPVPEEEIRQASNELGRRTGFELESR